MSDYPESPLSVFEFFEMFPDESSAAEYLAQWRWPDGFICPACDSRRHTRLKTRPIWECRDCLHQTSVTAGTVMHRSKVPILTWLFALWCIGCRKTSISAMQFMQETKLRSYQTAWTLLHKVRRVLDESGDYPLNEGKVEVDESLVPASGENSGRIGRRLGDGDAWVVVAVERIEKTKEVKGEEETIFVSGSAQLEVINRTDGETLTGFVKSTVKPGATVVTDGLISYAGLGELGYDHEIHNQTSAEVTKATLPKVHLLFSNLKAWLIGTFHGVTARYLWSYAREYIYRFNRRHREPALFGFIVRRLMTRPWTSCAELKS